MKRMRSLVISSRRLAVGAVVLAALGAAAFAAGPIPRPAPPLDFTDSTGKHVVLSSLKGKVVVVQFLLTTCPHCQKFSLLLNKLQADYGAKGFQALGAAVNEATPEMARDYHAQYAQAFPVGPLTREPLLMFLSLSVMDRPGFPQIAVVDRKGQIREQTTLENIPQPLQDEAHLRGLVQKLLAEGSGGGPSAPSKSGGAVAPKAPATTKPTS
jgi:thiol-disulfide isomerase/thioredoxin